MNYFEEKVILLLGLQKRLRKTSMLDFRQHGYNTFLHCEQDKQLVISAAQLNLFNCCLTKMKALTKAF